MTDETQTTQVDNELLESEADAAEVQHDSEATEQVEAGADEAQERTESILNERDDNRVRPPRNPADELHVHRPEKRADKHENIPKIHMKRGVDAEQIHADHGKHRPNPDVSVGRLFQEYSQDRDKNDI